MEIREATKKDVRGLSRLNAYVQRLHAEAYPEMFKSPENDDFAMTFFVAMLDDPEMFVYLAEEGDEAIGYLLMTVCRQRENPFMYALDYLQIDHIGVLPEYQGKGIGKALMAYAEEFTAQKGLGLVGLDSWSFNTEAHEFFHAVGFENYIIHMWKKIGGQSSNRGNSGRQIK